MSADLQTLATLLQGTLDPQQNREAESELQELEVQDGFSLGLLHIVATEAYPYTTRLAGALCFKNFIRRRWTDEDGIYLLPQSEVTAIKQELIGLMVSMPAGIQAQLGDAISVIAESDFFERWDTLVDELVARLTFDNFAINNGVLQVAHSIFKRWRPLFRSDQLYTEINHVLAKFGTAYLTLFGKTLELIEENRDSKQNLKLLFATQNLLMKLFYDLSCQDLPPIFEENLIGIAASFVKYLDYENPLLSSDDDTEAELPELVKAGIFEVLVLYVQKFEDAFGPFLEGLVTRSWNLLTTLGPETKHDMLVSKILQFLTAVANNPTHAESFKDEHTLNELVEKGILPNLSLRESDVELFEDEPIEYIRRDLEGADTDSRRRAATDFLRQLLEKFEEPVTKVVSRYVVHYMDDFSKNPEANWKSKDAAIYLFSSIAARGVVTTSQGVKSTNVLVDVVDFFQKHIANDLVAERGIHPILKVDAIRYLYTFRSQMTKQQWQDAFPLLVKHLQSDSYVAYTYAAIAIERALHMANETREPVYGQAELQLISREILERLFGLIEREKAPEKVQENEFLMRCVMRVLIVAREDILKMAKGVLKHLVSITYIISTNPSNPRFYYYHFEALGALIRFAGPSLSTEMEDTLYGPFAKVLQDDIQEFMPYVFQLFAALLECNPAGPLSKYYKSLIPPILMPEIWDAKGNVPALVRFLSSVIQRDATDLAAEQRIEPILVIFQKLISKKFSESHAFDLLETVIASFSVSQLQPFFVPMFNLILRRLQDSKTETLSIRFVRFYHFMSARSKQGLGADFVVGVTDQIQEGVFVPLYTTIILPDTGKLVRPLDRKTAVVSLTHTLTDSAAFANKYRKGWAYTCEALLKLLEQPPVLSAAAGGQADESRAAVIAEHDVDDVTFGFVFTPLSTVRPIARDAFPDVGPDLKRWVGTSFREAEARSGGQMSAFMQERLSAEARALLASYMQN
ncbi:MAG: importin-alpha export receptor [Phylliscum demangeonii]|nr:MAG: importin-alpha export receptor [Phylliscum demangeonii]